MFRKYASCAGLAALILAPPAFAHHPSGVGSSGGAGPIATISASTLEQGHSTAAIFFEMVKIDAFSDTQLKTFAGQQIHAHSVDAILAPTLIYAYGVTNDLDLSIGAFVGLVACIAGTWMVDQPLLCLLLLAACIASYAAVGALIHVRRLPSIVVTLGMSFVWLGIAVILMPTPGG